MRKAVNVVQVSKCCRSQTSPLKWRGAMCLISTSFAYCAL